MTEPLTPDEVTDLVSDDIASWSPRKLEIIERAELSVAAFTHSLRLFSTEIDELSRKMREFAVAYRSSLR
jgi:hypothetical protein